MLKLNFIYLFVFLLSCANNSDENINNLVGISKQYYSNGKIKSEEFFIGKTKNGYSKEYYITGEIQSKINFKEGVKTGEGWNYYENGVVEAYLFFWDGKLIYKRYYDKASSFVKDEGTGIIYSKIDKSNFTINDTLINTITIASPDNSKVAFYVTEVDSNDNFIKPKLISLTNKNTVIHKEIINEKGTFTRGYLVEYIDIKSGKKTEYTYGVKIPVK